MKTTPNAHKEDCMCDECIKLRTISSLTKRDQDEAQRVYEQRRGAPIGSISVADALKDR